MRPRKIILCVDDNEQTLSVRKFLLETRGYRVLTATSGHEALEIVERHAPGDLSLLISDLMMPVMDGAELVRRVREVQPGLPTLMADVFLPKGACSPVELLERVRVLVARKRGPKKSTPITAPSVQLPAQQAA